MIKRNLIKDAANIIIMIQEGEILPLLYHFFQTIPGHYVTVVNNDVAFKATESFPSCGIL